MTNSEIIEVITAFENGEEIEFDKGGGWVLVDDPMWNFSGINYRVKPKEPKIERRYRGVQHTLKFTSIIGNYYPLKWFDTNTWTILENDYIDVNLDEL